MSRYTALFVIAIVVTVIFTPSVVAQGQPYMGGYLRDTVRTTGKVLLTVDFKGTDPSQFPSYSTWLAGVASIAGAVMETPNGWTYQNSVHLFKDNTVFWAPQAWYRTEQKYSYIKHVGYGHYYAFYVRMDMGHDKVIFKCYTYTDYRAWREDLPATSSWNCPTGATNFLVGRRYHNGVYVKHFQFGVESNSRIYTTSWKVLNDNPSYYADGLWRYLPGYVCWGGGGSSAITWDYAGTYCVGGLTYDGVNKDSSSNDMVRWKFTNSTIADDSQLWSGSGTVSDVVTKPYS